MFNQTNEKKSFYEILDLSSSASIDEIKESYARAKSTYSEENPALYGMVTKIERAQTLSLIEEAFKTLSNPELRKDYDSKIRGGNLFDFDFKTESRPEGFVLREKVLTPRENEQKYKNENSNNFEKKSIKKLIETNKYQLDFEIDENFEKNIREATQFNGKFLKDIREYKKVSIDKMSEMTKISKTNLTNLELEKTETMPAMVYVRGFVYQYAKCLKLNPELVASSYIHQLKKKLR